MSGKTFQALMAGVGTAAAATVTYVSSAFNDSPASSASTFASFNAGSGAITAIVVWVRSNSAAAGFTSAVSVNGSPATKQVDGVNAGQSEHSIWTVAANGASINVVVTTGSTTPIAVYIAAYALNNLQNGGTQSATATSNTNGGTMTLSTVPAGGVAIGGSGDGTTFTSTWTTLTKDSTSGGSRTQSTASAAFATTQTSLNITCTDSATGGTISQCAASFR